MEYLVASSAATTSNKLAGSDTARWFPCCSVGRTEVWLFAGDGNFYSVSTIESTAKAAMIDVT